MSTTTDLIGRIVGAGANVALAAGASAWPVLIAQYGFGFAVELAEILSKGGDPTVDELRAMQYKYGLKTADQYLAESALRLGTVTTS